MKPRRFPPLAAALLAGLLAAAPALPGDVAPVPAPGFTLPGRAGSTVELEALRGKVVLINFWASWCGPCRQEFPALDQIYRKYQPLGLALVGINVESESGDADRFLSGTPVSFPIAFDRDNSVAALYGVTAMPTTLLVDRQGKVRWQHRAYQQGDEAQYVDRVRALLREPQ